MPDALEPTWEETAPVETVPSWDDTAPLPTIDREKRKLRAEAALGKAEEFVADLGQRAAYTVSQMRPDIALSHLVELPYEIDRALGLVPKESPNPLAQPVVSPEQVRKAAEFVAPDVATIGQFGREAVSQFARPGVQLPVTAPPEGEIAKAIEGAKQFGAEFASGLTTPANVAAMVAAPTYPKAIGRTFQAAMIGESQQAIQNAIEAAKSGDTTRAVKAGLSATTTVGLPLAIERGIVVKPKIYERENLPVGSEIQPPQTIPSGKSVECNSAGFSAVAGTTSGLMSGRAAAACSRLNSLPCWSVNSRRSMSSGLSLFSAMMSLCVSPALPSITSPSIVLMAGLSWGFADSWANLIAANARASPFSKALENKAN